ncbi:MAG: thymidylate synthase (FAD) [Thermofilum sp. ex4484_79]|nr:MAG: thymidylate synthase (FAD) [Thermofilum sp. ex4484_79]
MEVYILNYIPEAEKITASIAWSSISLFCAPEYESMLKEKDIEKMFKLARKMKLSSVLDFPYYIISFKDVSRSFTHQWVRYRIAAHVQQSLRFTEIDTKLKNEKPWFVIPPMILQNSVDVIVKYIKSQINAGRAYRELIKKGIPAEDARFTLPIGVKTHISSAMDAEELLHVIDQRTCFDAQWEIRSATYALLSGLYAVSPRIFKNAGPYCVSERVCRGRQNGRCYYEAKLLTEKMIKIGEKFREMMKDARLGEYISMDLTDVLGYRVPEDKKKEVWEALGYELDIDYCVTLHIRKVADI